MPLIESNNATFYYEQHGEGEHIILVSGLTADHHSWDMLVPLLSQHYQVTVFDNRAVGQTTDDGRELTINLMAEDTLALMQALDIEKAHFVGQSMGGSIVTVLAAKHPECVDKLIILNSSPIWKTATLMICKIGFRMRKAAVDFDTIVYPFLAAWLFSEKSQNTSALINGFKDSLLNNPYPQSETDHERQLNALLNYNGVHLLKNIQAKTLIGYGPEDMGRSIHDTEIFKRELHNVEVVAFENSAHLSHIETPEAVSARLIEFLHN